MFEEGSTYYIRVRGRVQGPFDLEQLKKLRQRGQFSRAHEVSPDQASWQSASILDDVFVAPKRAAPAKVEPAVEEFVDAVDAEETVPTPKTRASSTKPVWHYTVGEEQYGPVTLLELRKLVANGELMETDLVWKEGMPDWIAVIDLDELHVSSSASTSPKAPSDSSRSQSPGQANAGFWFRFFAFLIDGLVIGTVGGALTTVLIIVLTLGFHVSLLSVTDRPSDAAEGAFTLAILLSWAVVAFANFILHWLYYAFMESSSHRGTLGKLACGIIVTDESGAPLSFAQATGRYFAKFVTNATFGLGYLMCIWTQREQCLHDKMAGCLVLKK